MKNGKMFLGILSGVCAVGSYIVGEIRNKKDTEEYIDEKFNEYINNKEEVVKLDTDVDIKVED